MTGMAELQHPLWRSIRRGLAERCPQCAKGRVFGRYLKVQPHCEACGHELALYPADDGPAYLTILLVGHLIIGPMLLFPIVWESDPRIVVPIALSTLTVVTLSALPRIKGGWIGMMYALGVTSRNATSHTADTAE